MNLPKKMLDGIERFLSVVPVVTQSRGRVYFTGGKVTALECVEEGHLYTAVVQGSEDYDVGLEYADEEWAANCSCPMQYDCKHIVATMLELRRLAAAARPVVMPKIAPERKSKLARTVPQPPKSPLYEKLAAALGRPLGYAEAEYVRKVQALYSNGSVRPLMESDFGLIIGGGSNYSYWKPVELWRDFPKDDFLAWQYVARELRRRKAQVPEFMEAITNPALIEAEMAAWEREKEIEEWKDWFRNFEDKPPVSQASELDLRLMIHAEEARLQWRMGAGTEFADLKQGQAKKFAEQFERGTLNLAADSLALWSAVFKPWHYESWWSFRYDSTVTKSGLNRLLRMPLAPERIVTPDNQPLRRVAEPLKLLLRPPKEGDDAYEIALTAADGSPAPEILCALVGQPTLYLTRSGLFAGPPPDALEKKSPQSIPAPALETLDGLRFLHATGIPMPEHLAHRVRTVPVRVSIFCELQPTYPGSRNEDIAIRVKAESAGMKAEHFTPQGWETKSGGREEKSQGTAKGLIHVHDRVSQKHFPGVLEPLGLKWEGYNAVWKLRLTKKTPDTFVPWLKSLPPDIEVMLDKELMTLRDEPVSGSVSLDVTESTMDWFDLKVVLNMGDTTLTPEELKLLLNARGGYVRLGDKGWRRLKFDITPEENEQLARLGLNAKDFSGEPQRFHALQLADEAAKKFLAPERVEKIQRRVNELKARVSPALPPAISAELRPYQSEGYHFLAYLTENRFGGVLADDMGLGKTLQTLAWLAWLRDAGRNPQTMKMNPSLVVCPKSVTDNWRSESERFYPGLRVRVWKGEPPEALAEARKGSDLIVMNYSQLRFLSPAISETPWQAAILDEAQYIKNPDSQTAQAARALKADHRLALTGTPIENRLLDLWSILSFAMPGALGNRAQFLRRFDAKDDPLARRRLAARVRPFLLRRTKGQVAKDLPDRAEEDLLCEMEGEQKTLYRAELKRARQIIMGLKTSKHLNAERFNILTSLLRLRQICCHPALVNEKLREAESAKVSALLDLLEPLMEEGHKVLVFSQFVTMLDILRDTVTARGWNHFYLAGSTENRGDLVREFQSARGGAVFLISLKAGGFGLNLTAASYVVLFDPWWNPAVENQAIDRTHRIGQTSKVMAYRLLMRDSIEQKIRALQKQKAALMDDVLGEERFAQSLTLDDLRFLFSE